MDSHHLYLVAQRTPSMDQIAWEELAVTFLSAWPEDNGRVWTRFPVDELDIDAQMRHVMVEADFAEERLDPRVLVSAVAEIMGFNESEVLVTLTFHTYLTKASTTFELRLKGVILATVLVLGGLDATWDESMAECQAYLLENTVLWDGEQVL